jgi:hypothetical protein
MIGWHAHRLLRRKDIELPRIEDEAPALPDRVPKVEHLELVLTIDIDETGMTLGTEADRLAGIAFKIDRERQASGNVWASTGNQGLVGVEFCDGGVGAGDRTLAEADLTQSRSRTNEGGKGARADLSIERTVIGFGNRIELAGMIGDDTGKDIEPAG